MKKTIVHLLCLILLTSTAWAQQKDSVETLIEEGIGYHDKGNYAQAISLYDKALTLDKDNLLALAEKAFSLMELKKYEDAIVCCKQVLAVHAGKKETVMTYVTYGNALDALHKATEAVNIYNEGLKFFPNNYLLYFNKGVTLSSLKQMQEALVCFQQALVIKPTHTGSHNAIASLLLGEGNKIPALLASSRCLIIEPQTQRAKDNFARIQSIMKANVQKTGENAMTINLDSKLFKVDKNADGEILNDFTTVELLLSLTAVEDYDEKNSKVSEVEKFIAKMKKVCSSLTDYQRHKGFYWQYYAPYFVEMNQKNLVETFGYIAFVSTNDTQVIQWLKEHKENINQFYEWSNKYDWTIK